MRLNRVLCVCAMMSGAGLAQDAFAGVVLPGPDPDGVQTITVFNVGGGFPFFGLTSALLDQLPGLGGFEIIETRAEWTIQTTDAAYDFSDAIFSLSAPLFTENGTERVFAEFDAADTGSVGLGTLFGRVTTDQLNGEIWNNGQIFSGGKEETGEGGGEPIPAALFEWSVTAGDLGHDPELPYGVLSELFVQIDIRPIPAPGSVALFGIAGVGLVRRRREASPVRSGGVS